MLARACLPAVAVPLVQCVLYIAKQSSRSRILMGQPPRTPQYVEHFTQCMCILAQGNTYSGIGMQAVYT